MVPAHSQPAPSPPDCVVAFPGGNRSGAECAILEVNRREVTISVEALGAKGWKSGDTLELVADGQEPVPATIRSLHPNGEMLVVALKAQDPSALAALAPRPMPSSSNKRASFRTRVGPDTTVQVTVRTEPARSPGRHAPTSSKGFPGFLLDASFDGTCILVDRAAAAALPRNSLVRVKIATATVSFEVFGAIRHCGRVPQGVRLGIETGSFPHAHWPESQERLLREFVLDQQRAELQRRQSA